MLLITSRHIFIRKRSNKVIPRFFASGEILSHSSQYQSYFCHSALKSTYAKLVSCGEYNKTSKQQLAVYCYCSTIMATQYPMFILDDGKHCVLPRPYNKCKPGNTGFELMMQPWFCAFVADIESAVMYFIKNMLQDEAIKN